MKKIDLAKDIIQKNIEIFKCPVCGNEINIMDYSLICPNKHCFDLSKYGYVNLVLNSKKADYDKLMLESRNIICNSDFFTPMIQGVSDLIVKWIKNGLKNINILDAGCGEGSHLSNILADLNGKYTGGCQGIGIDISKEGIHIAAREHRDIIWCVADLAKIPFMDKKFDVILNILSPSNYSEFNRVLKDDGVLIKVVPESNYLHELRSVFYDNTDKQTYSNEKVIKHFDSNFDVIDKKHISYTAVLDDNNIEHLIRMTPLSWNVKKEKIEKLIELKEKKITVDLTILVGKKSI